MPNWSKKSAERLATCDTDLMKLFNKVLDICDCKVIDWHRDEARQNRYNDEEKSQLRWPDSGHNKYPSKAVDVAPYPIDWDDRERFIFFRNLVYFVAHTMGIKLKPTIDWDLAHWELR